MWGERYVFFPWKTTITILSRFFVMLVLLFCKLSEQYSQTNFPIIKTKTYKVNKYKIKKMADIYAKVGEDKKINVAIIFPAVKVNADQQLFGYPHYLKKKIVFVQHKK